MTEKLSFHSQIRPEDLPKIAQEIFDEFRERQKRRSHLEDHWKEIDRQLRMEPDTAIKKTRGGKTDDSMEWYPEIELPLQAQTLEVLLSDIKRFKFPKGKDWMRARAALTPKYIDAYQSVETPVVGEKGRDLGQVTGETADQFARSVVSHFHRQYDFRGHVALCDTDALKYGFGVGRVKRVNKTLFQFKGEPKKQKIPMLVPRSAKNVYLDDSQANVMHEGETIGPNIIQTMERRLVDVLAAAKDDDSYIESQLKRLKPDSKGNIRLVELEGDLIYGTSQQTIVVQNVVLTAALGEQKNPVFGLIREQKGEGYSTYLIFDYHKESAQDAYATAPLMKGRPLQKIATLTMSDLIASGQLKIRPPLNYRSDDPFFAGTGGPVVAPGETWKSTDGVDAVDVGGDPAVFFANLQGLREFYNDVTGGHPARLGAQTKSHTTAFAKDAELSQGSVRTVDYTDDSLLMPMTRLLEIEYRMGLENWPKQVVYIESWDDFVELQRKHLPDVVRFDALGAGAPLEDRQKLQEQIGALQSALQIEFSRIEAGNDPRLNLDEMQDYFLEKGGIEDISRFVREGGEPVNGNGQAPGLVTAEPRFPIQ